MENSETKVWLRFSLACQYIDMEAYKSLVRDTQEIGRMIDHMINHPEKFARNW